ncbi:MAG: heavy-metal-associated domain-containing protein [Ignavibacteriae bacterium]|nr:heavy-metal-associated domain-containing protein [Ignavibacteriota bacterium]
MKKTYKVQNIKCEGCANTVSKKLKYEYGDVEINLSVMPREITLNIEEGQEEKLKVKLKKMGYPFYNEKLHGLENVEAKAKSFVSCAIGKMTLEK